MNTHERLDLSRYTEASARPDETKWEGHMADDVAATSGLDPMALLRATSDYLHLTSTRGDFKVPRTAITKIGRGKFYPWMFSAVRIHHTSPGLPRELQFKPMRAKVADVFGQLRTLGYPVA